MTDEEMPELELQPMVRSQVQRPTQPDIRLVAEAESVIQLTQQALVGWPYDEEQRNSRP